MEKVIDLGLIQIASAYIFILILLIIVHIKGISREKEILIASIRMSLQLALIGYVLIYVFDNPSPLITLPYLFVMQVFSIHNIIKRNKKEISLDLKKIIFLSMVIGTSISIFYFLLVVVRLKPWFEPRYFIPISGMLIGNAMTGVSLGVNKLVDDMENQEDLIEGALILGATPKVAAKQVVDGAFDASILPTINSMLGIGIVFLPGMMTGQILAGLSPISAIKYQLAIMLGILGSVSLSVFVFVNLGYKTFFNSENQLKF